MKKLVLAGLVAAALTAACNQTKTTETATTSAPGTGAAPADSTKGLSGLFNSFWEKQSRLDPLSATAYGDNRYNDQLPNNQTHAYRDTMRVFYQGYLTKLQKFDREKLSDND